MAVTLGLAFIVAFVTKVIWENIRGPWKNAPPGRQIKKRKVFAENKFRPSLRKVLILLLPPIVSFEAVFFLHYLTMDGSTIIRTHLEYFLGG